MKHAIKPIGFALGFYALVIALGLLLPADAMLIDGKPYAVPTGYAPR